MALAPTGAPRLYRRSHGSGSVKAARARSSAGEHYVDIVGVTGSIPVAPTMGPKGFLDIGPPPQEVQLRPFPIPWKRDFRECGCAAGIGPVETPAAPRSSSYSRIRAASCAADHPIERSCRQVSVSSSLSQRASGAKISSVQSGRAAHRAEQLSPGVQKSSKHRRAIVHKPDQRVEWQRSEVRWSQWRRIYVDRPRTVRARRPTTWAPLRRYRRRKRRPLNRSAHGVKFPRAFDDTRRLAPIAQGPLIRTPEVRSWRPNGRPLRPRNGAR